MYISPENYLIIQYVYDVFDCIVHFWWFWPILAAVIYGGIWLWDRWVVGV